MSLSQLRNVNFGTGRTDLTGSSGVSYQVLDTGGSIVSGPTTSGVFQVVPGVYAANVPFPDSFNGQIVWTCPSSGSLGTVYAVEQYNVEENDPKVANNNEMLQSLTGSVQFLTDMEGGRWRLDASTKQMIFFALDNTTEVARFNLFDLSGNPTVIDVSERVRV